MKSNRPKKCKDSIKKKQQIPPIPKEKLIKFNLSYENLKCFMKDRYPKTDRKKVSNKQYFNLTDSKKYNQTEQEGVQVYHKIIRESSPDPSQQASNEIIQQIQRKGLKCVWHQIQQSKTQVSNQQQWRQKQLLHQTFSQHSNSTTPKSFASTNHFSGYYSRQSQIYQQPQQVTYVRQADLAMQQKRYYSQSFTFQINLNYIEDDQRTTLMIRNIPNKYTIQDLSREIDFFFQDSYDFLYLPCDIKNNCNVGYGFINFVDTSILKLFYQKFHNQKWIKFRSEKICELTYARLQGLSSLIQHFQNSKVLNYKDKRYQPIIRDIKSCKKISNLIKQQQSEQPRLLF